MKALVLAPTAAPELVDLPDASGAELLAGLQAAVGGYIEPIITWDGARLYVNDEGRVRRMTYNRLATVLAHRFGWPGDSLFGTAVVIGSAAGDDGLHDCDVPAGAVELVEKLMDRL